jgi:site-specific recombinase XerD
LQRHTNSGDVFETERGTPFTSDALNRLIRRIDERAGSSMQGSPAHAAARLRLRAGRCGHDTRAIQDWLGPRAVQHTARYTELSQETI